MTLLMKRKWMCTTALFVFLSVPMFSQTHPINGNDYTYQVPAIEDLVKVPPSPEAQAFQKFGSIPMNLYTGTSNITVPIATLKGREIEIPISLNYDATGVKVEQIATWVGLGWSLNAGGMVTRNNNGNPDDYLSANPAYYPFYVSTINSDYELARTLNPMEGSDYPSGNLKRYFDFMWNVVQAKAAYKAEIQPDTYSFNALGISGTVYIDYTAGVGYCMEHPEIKVIPTFQVTSGVGQQVITAWTITDEHGNTYYFNLPEVTYTYDGNANETYTQYNSSWMLTRVETRNHRDVIDYTYNTIPQWQQPQLAGRGDSRIDVAVEEGYYGTDQMNYAPVPLYTISQSELTGIIVNGVLSASFIASTTPRQDLKGRNALAEIDILDPSGSGNVRSIFKLGQSYFGTGTNEKSLRLKLDRVELHGATVKPYPQKYSFSYIGGDLPPRDSYAQDFWGYYNGMDQNTTLIPYNSELDPYNSYNNNFQGANRNPNFGHASRGTLSKITYPTGGSTEYTYGSNQSSTVSYSYTESFYVGEAQLTGGADPSNTYNFCDQGFITTFPSGTDGAFQITTPGSYQVQISNASSGNLSGPKVQFLAMYYVGGDGSFTPPARDFCDLWQNAPYPDIYMYHNTYDLTQNMYLKAGWYRILILNSDPTLTVSFSVKGTRTISVYDGAGLATKMAVDKDDNGRIVSKKVYYYGDASTLASSNLTQDYLMNTPQLGGTLHATINYEETKYIQKYSTSSSQPDLLNYSVLERYSSNRTHSKYQFTYPVVTEVQFSTPSGISAPQLNGFTVYEFYDRQDNYAVGYSMLTSMNGKLKRKRTFDQVGNELVREENSSHEQVIGAYVGFCFTTNLMYRKDIYVKSLLSDPSNELFFSEDPLFAGFGSGELSENHCSDGGYIMSTFANRDSAINYLNRIRGSYSTIIDDTNDENPSTGHWYVGYLYYNIISCYNLGNKFNKYVYEYPRFWTTDDGTKVTEFSNGTLITTTNNFYDNPNHYQVTRVQQTDSKGVVHSVLLEYADELHTQNPSDPIWSSLINQNRIAEPVRKTATYANGQPDYIQNTVYKSITAGGVTMIVPDYLQFSTGGNPLETRIRYHQYDNVGNPVEVSKENDVHISYQWGYNQTYPVAEIKNASAGTFAYTSFENQDTGGWTYTLNPVSSAFKTGGYSHQLSGNNVTRSGLTATNTYTISYWALGGAPTLSGGVIASNDSPAPTADGWQYFEKTITGVTSITLSSAGSLYIDELRIYPALSQLTTFSYLAPIGQVNTTDPNGVTSYFEYDTYGRLVLVRDCNRKILKQFKYHYRDLSKPGGGSNQP
jgi:YD repeat-containing protein